MIGWSTWLKVRGMNFLVPIEILPDSHTVSTKLYIENGVGFLPENIVGELWLEEDNVCLRFDRKSYNYAISLSDFLEQFEKEE